LGLGERATLRVRPKQWCSLVILRQTLSREIIDFSRLGIPEPVKFARVARILQPAK
jgi:hypothetical protein